MKRVRVSESKSVVNRILILSSFSASELPTFSTQAVDVCSLRAALVDFRSGKTDFFLREGGSSFRFLLARISRQPGSYRIFAQRNLLARPHDELYRVLRELSVTIIENEDHIAVVSRGWKEASEITVDCSMSTQYASAVLLSSLDLDIKIEFENLGPSLPYLEMTKKLIERRRNMQASVLDELQVEPDLSSAFQLAAVALVSSGAIVESLPLNSLQADAVFVEFLQKMGGRIERKCKGDVFDLLVYPSKNDLQAVELDLKKCPDLFPSMAVLCALAEGESLLTGIAATRFKESDRVAKVSQLLTAVSVSHCIEENSINISGGTPNFSNAFNFNPENDHRLAMAAAVFKAAGAKIEIENSEVVDKSYPDFWQACGIVP